MSREGRLGVSESPVTPSPPRPPVSGGGERRQRGGSPSLRDGGPFGSPDPERRALRVAAHSEPPATGSPVPSCAPTLQVGISSLAVNPSEHMYSIVSQPL